ncbi:hypothetical protein HPB47_014036, partial [Ixodes persulcatus]
AGPSSGQDIPSVEMEELPIGTSSASSTISYYESISDDPVVLKPKDPSKIIATINPLKITEKLEMTAPDGIILVRPNRRLNLLASIDTRNRDATKALLAVTTIGGIPVQAYEPFPRESPSHVAHAAGDHMNAPAAMQTTPSARTAAKLTTRHLIFVRHTKENKRYTSTRAKLKLAMRQRKRRCSHRKSN